MEARPPEVETPTAACRHHWLIETPHGREVEGHCKLCNARRTFLATLDLPGASKLSLLEDEC